MSKQIQLTSGMSRYTIQYYKSVEEIKQLFYVEPMISTIEELKEFINQQTNKEQRYWRGLNDGSFTILAKSYVDFCQKELFNIYDNYNRYLQRLWDIAKADTSLASIYQYYKRQNTNYSQYTPLWGLSILQHYATGTPLIDWTNDIWSALYFAWNGAKPSPQTSHKLSDYIQLNFFDYDIHIAQPSVPKGNQKDSPAPRMTILTQNTDLEELRQLSKDKIITIDSFCSYKWSCDGSYEETGALYRNDRSDKQHGFFILHLEDCETLEEKWNRIFKEDTSQNSIARNDTSKMQLHKVLIHKSLIPYIEGLLKGYWGGENLNEILLPQKYVDGCNLCQIAQHIFEKAQTKA